MSFPRWWAWAPRVVAEGLRPLTDPLTGHLSPGPLAHPAAVARALAQSLAPPRATESPPAWLDAAQGDAFRLLLHAVRTHGAALSADPVGSGKTYVALAVAKVLSQEPVACVVPATLVPQWEETARRLDVPSVVWSHALLSRGRLPPGAPTLVIVDESHHFRHPDIRRYTTLAPWLIGRRVLLLSATPIVNHSSDLYHQLHLGLRDDALADAGTGSLRRAFGRDIVPASLGQFVVQRLDSGGSPRSCLHETVVASGATPLLARLDQLKLSSRSDIAALVRTVLVHAAASSAAALQAALRRYQLLLHHAQDSAAAGQTLDRRQLRRLVGPAEEQLVLWALMSGGGEGSELRLDDLPAVEAMISDCRHLARLIDAKASRLRELLEDQIPTLVFVSARETITYLRHQLPDRWLAWCTGRNAGIGRWVVPRQEVLRWFRPDGAATGPPLPGQPRSLLTTDVTAEGLDLQAAGRVVHYDLPWTDVRQAQRNGRAVRRGSVRSAVDIVRFLPPSEVETRLRQQEHLLRKSTLPMQHGIGAGGRLHWRWRREQSDALGGLAVEGHCAVRSEQEGALAGVVLDQAGGPSVAVVFCRDARGAWCVDPATIETRLEEASRAEPGPPPPPELVRTAVESITPSIRSLLRDAGLARITGVPQRAAAIRLTRRLHTLAAEAARERNTASLKALDQALRFCTGGHTAGETLLIEQLAALDSAQLLGALASVPDRPHRLPPHRPRLTGLILFLPT